jgi:hypothetical protein
MILGKLTAILFTGVLILAPSRESIRSVRTSDLPETLLRISKIEDDVTRLAAYDELAATLPPTSSEPSGNWAVHKSLSRMDDSIIMTLVTDSQTTVSGWPNKESAPRLLIRTQEGSISAFLEIGMSPHPGSGSKSRVTVRFDSLNTEDYSCSISTSGESLFIPDAKSFIRLLRKSEIVAFRFTPFNSEPVIAEFRTEGLDNILPEFVKASGWDIYNPVVELEERLKDLSSRDLLLPLVTIEGNSISIKMEGNNFQGSQRGNMAIDKIESALRMVDEATSPWQDPRYRISVFGTTYQKKKREDGGDPFKCEELERLTKKALLRMDWDQGAFDVIAGGNRKPVRYGSEGPTILRGTVKDTGEEVVIEVLGLGLVQLPSHSQADSPAGDDL